MPTWLLWFWAFDACHSPSLSPCLALTSLLLFTSNWKFKNTSILLWFNFCPTYDVHMDKRNIFWTLYDGRSSLFLFGHDSRCIWFLTIKCIIFNEVHLAQIINFPGLWCVYRIAKPGAKIHCSPHCAFMVPFGLVSTCRCGLSSPCQWCDDSLSSVGGTFWLWSGPLIDI